MLLEVVDHFAEIGGPLFERKFGHPAPSNGWPHHICAFSSSAPGALTLLGYVHFGRFGDTCLVGGMCTDGEAVRALPQAQREVIRAAGGVAYSMLRYGFVRFADEFAAFFGLVGDPRAREVDLAAGFEETEHEKLVMYLPRPLSADHQRALKAKVLALGDF